MKVSQKMVMLSDAIDRNAELIATTATRKWKVNRPGRENALMMLQRASDELHAELGEATALWMMEQHPALWAALDTLLQALDRGKSLSPTRISVEMTAWLIRNCETEPDLSIDDLTYILQNIFEDA